MEWWRKHVGAIQCLPPQSTLFRGAKLRHGDTRETHLTQRRFFSNDIKYAGEYCYVAGSESDERILYELTTGIAQQLIRVDCFSLIQEGISTKRIPLSISSDPVGYQINRLPEILMRKLDVEVDGLCRLDGSFSEVLLLRPAVAGSIRTHIMPDAKDGWRTDPE